MDRPKEMLALVLETPELFDVLIAGIYSVTHVLRRCQDSGHAGAGQASVNQASQIATLIESGECHEHFN